MGWVGWAGWPGYVVVVVWEEWGGWGVLSIGGYPSGGRGAPWPFVGVTAQQQQLRKEPRMRRGGGTRRNSMDGVLLRLLLWEIPTCVYDEGSQNGTEHRGSWSLPRPQSAHAPARTAVARQARVLGCPGRLRVRSAHAPLLHASPRVAARPQCARCPYRLRARASSRYPHPGPHSWCPQQVHRLLFGRDCLDVSPQHAPFAPFRSLGAALAGQSVEMTSDMAS